MSTQTPRRDGAVPMTPAGAARLAKVSCDTIYREIDRGSLRALHVGGRLLRISLDASMSLTGEICLIELREAERERAGSAD